MNKENYDFVINNSVKKCGGGVNIINIIIDGQHEIDYRCIEKYHQYDERIAKIEERINKRDAYDVVSDSNDIYEWLVKQLKNKENDKEIISIAYRLADIYDRTFEYARSLELADLILEMLFPLDNEKYATYHNMRMYIGCLYSYIIDKRLGSAEKNKVLNQVEKLMKSVAPYINDKKYSHEEYLILYGLYESNMGALWINRADISNNKERYIDCLDEARRHHTNSLAARKELIEYARKIDDVKKMVEMEKSFYKSKSNLAVIEFRKENYDMAVRLHDEVLQYRQQTEDVANIHLTKLYIIGCVCGKTKKYEPISEEELKMCEDYIDECSNYYLKKGDTQKQKEVESKREEIEKYKAKNLTKTNY